MPLVQTEWSKIVHLLISDKLRKIWKGTAMATFEARSHGLLHTAEKCGKTFRESCRCPGQHSKPRTQEYGDSREVQTMRQKWWEMKPWAQTMQTRILIIIIIIIIIIITRTKNGKQWAPG